MVNKRGSGNDRSALLFENRDTYLFLIDESTLFYPVLIPNKFDASTEICKFFGDITALWCLVQEIRCGEKNFFSL